MNKSKIKQIKDVVVACTEKCNSRCRMCNIWKKEVNMDQELNPADFLHLPKTLTNLNISGGEPFLRNDLVEIVANIKKASPKAKIVFSSNGFATKKIIKAMQELQKIDSSIAVVISIDGVGENHDKVRGIPGGFKMSMATVEELKKIGVNTKIAFTIADYNYFDLRNVYNLSRELGVEMSLALVHSSENYFAKDNNIKLKNEIEKSLNWLIQKELSSWSPKRWARAYFTYGLREFLLTGSRVLPDYSGEKSLFISSNGDVFPNDINSNKIGKMNKDGFKVDGEIRVDDYPSWMICTTRTAIKKHFGKVGLWIIKNKLKNLFYDRSNFFYYLLGLTFMSLNKIRYALLGYHHPRPIAKSEIAKNVQYSKDVIINFLSNLRREINLDYNLEGKACLEIGPGSDFGTGLLTLSKGARSYIGVDRFHLLSFNGDFYDALGESLEYNQQELIKSVILGIKKSIQANEKGEIAVDNFSYLNTPFEKVGERLEAKQDLIFSQAVLEHTYSPEKVFEQIYELLNDGGIMIHEIDMATHTSLLHEWDVLNILRYSEKVYSTLKFQGSPNRLRISDYQKIVEKLGFKDIKVIPLTQLSLEQVEKIKPGLSCKYRQYKTEDLQILTALLIAKK